MKCIQLEMGITVLVIFKPLFSLPREEGRSDLLNQIIWMVSAWLIFKSIKLTEKGASVMHLVQIC